MNSKFLLGVSVFAVVIIAVIVIFVLENESSLTEQEIRESIQNEILKSPQITGVNAQTICKILEIDCSDQTSFHAAFDLTDGYTKFAYSQNDMQYNFRITDDVLEYKTNRNPDEWMMYEDIWMWNEDVKTSGDTIKEDILSEQYSRTFQFDSDKLGNYKNWCSTYNGIYYSSETNSKGECEFTTEKDHDEARDGLHELEKKKISGELAQKLCRAYGKECLYGISITMEYDMETGYLLKDKKIEGQYYEFRIIEDDIIQYRTGHYPHSPWTTFQGD